MIALLIQDPTARHEEASMIILFWVFLVIAFRPDFHPPPFPVSESDALGSDF